MRRGMNIEGYFVKWDSANHKITITPEDDKGDFKFGLGNAIVDVSIEHLPEKLIETIDDDPDFDINKLAVPIDYGSTHLVQPASNMVKKTKTLKLSNGRSKKLEYYSGDIDQYDKTSENTSVSGLYNAHTGVRIFR